MVMSDIGSFNDLAKAYGLLKQNGMSLQRRGLELVRIADSGLANIAPLETFVIACRDLSRDHPQVVQTVQFLLDSEQHTLALLDEANASLAAAVPQVNVSVLLTSSAASGSNVAAGTAVETLLELVPERRDFILRGLPPGGFARSFTEAELDAYLARFGDDLPRRRQGAWAAYYSASGDGIAQASHSMRDVLAKLISKEAANDKIESCSWYQERKGRKPETKPSINDRIRFLLYGPSEREFDKLELENIEKAVHLYVNDDGALKSTAHGSTSISREQVKFAMEKIEELLFLILRRLYKGS